MRPRSINFSGNPYPFFNNSRYLRFPKGLRDPWTSLGGPFRVRGGQGRSVKRSGDPKGGSEGVPGRLRTSSFLFLLEVNVLMF